MSVIVHHHHVVSPVIIDHLIGSIIIDNSSSKYQNDLEVLLDLRIQLFGLYHHHPIIHLDHASIDQLLWETSCK